MLPVCKSSQSVTLVSGVFGIDSDGMLNLFQQVNAAQTTEYSLTVMACTAGLEPDCSEITVQVAVIAGGDQIVSDYATLGVSINNSV